jgi:dipeptidyl aminopeptidase/acylaminoacyl peptidase
MPVLVFSGDADWLVPLSETKLLEKVLRENKHPDYTVKIFPHLDHRFTKAKSMEQSFKSMTSIVYLFEWHPLDPQVLQALLEWLKSKS